jgi:hypothetical protein
MRASIHIVVLILLATLTSITAVAQNTGVLKGTVTDESGGVVPAVNVTATDNGATKAVQTQADGTYTISGLPPGQYTVQVNVPGFTPFSKDVAVSAGAAAQLPVSLAISTARQQVTVAAEPGPTVSVEPDNNAAAVVLKGEDLQSLPDDPDDLADALQALAGPGAGPNGGEIYIDGFTGGELPPKETIREIRVNQNPFSAEYDKLGFGRIEILTKPGADKVRGMLFLNDSDATFNSRNPFAGNKPAYSNRMYGGNVAGPINKRASFFFDFNERDITNNAITNALYFDPATFSTSHVTTAVVTPQMNRTINPRVDYQLTTNNTLTVRFEDRMGYTHNSGLGGYRLPPPYSNLAYNLNYGSQNLTATETAVLGPRVVNETRFQFVRYLDKYSGNQRPQINVANSFITGGNGVGNEFDLSRHFELQNYTSISKGSHTIRFGFRARRRSEQNNNPTGFNGTFSFLGGTEPVIDAANNIVYDQNGNAQTTVLTSLQQYQRNLELAKAGLSQSQIQALGGGPSRFTIQAGQPYISMVRYDAGPFVQDDWRVRQNFTLSVGLRYEVQTLLHDYSDWAPRIGFAWAPGGAKNGRQKTVIRGGVGIFYDRMGFTPFETAALNNGHTQVQYTVYNPDFYPNIPDLSTLSPGQNAAYRLDPKLRAAYSVQSAIGIERQVGRNTTLSATYTYNRAAHYLQTVPVNAPIPGSFNPLQPLGPANGVFPLGYNAGNVFEYQSGGILRQRIFMVSATTRLGSHASLYGNYQLTYANDLPTMPTNPYDFRLDYGRSTLDRRHNFQLFGSVAAPLGIRLAPFITVRSGAPYDVLIGEDLYGDTFTNARAAFASPGTCPAGFSGIVGNVVCSPAGEFTTAYNPAQPGNVVPRNYLTMAGLVSVNFRIYRVFGFGGQRKTPGRQPGMGGHFDGGHGGRGGGAMSMGPSAGPHGMMGATTEQRFSLLLGVNVTNVLNHLNPGGYQGVITSPQFLEATSVNTGFGGGGFGGPGGGAANNRRVEFDLRLTF